MPRHLAFFLIVLAFLSGIVYASLGLQLLYSLVPAAFLFGALLTLGESWQISFLAALLLLAGSFYYFWDDGQYRALVSRLPQEGQFSGIIINDPRQGQDGLQSFYLQTDAGKLIVSTAPTPKFSYGDALTAASKIQTPQPDSYGRYLAKEKVVGQMASPQIALISSGGGNKILALLFRLKQKIKLSFDRLLPPDKAAFLFGVMMGVNENFSKQFSQNLQQSGLRFLTAIDGLHMTIMVFIIYGLLVYFLPRRQAFLLTFIIIALFVALTGFTVSGIRASVMAFAAGLSTQFGWKYEPRNALCLAALVLILQNPKIPVFDVGFQLSFLAVLSIIYFKPVLACLLRLDGECDFFGFKTCLLITLSVQLATAPVLITQFQNFSLTAFVASVAVVVVLPYLLGTGLLLAIFSLIFYPLARVVGFAVSPLIAYVIFIINLFAKWAAPFNPKFSPIAIAAYYLILIALMFWFYRKKPSPAATGELVSKTENYKFG
jgi:competence protein ComEC